MTLDERCSFEQGIGRHPDKLEIEWNTKKTQSRSPNVQSVNLELAPYPLVSTLEENRNASKSDKRRAIVTSLLVCPLCGKSSSLRNYDPTSLALDVYAKSLRGRGKGKGFDLVREWSILDEDPGKLSGMSHRLLDLLDLFVRKGLMEREYILEKLGPQEEESIVLDEAEASSVDLEEDVEALAEWIREELGLDGLSGKDPLDRLKNGIKLLIDEVEAGRADAEESGH